MSPRFAVRTAGPARGLDAGTISRTTPAPWNDPSRS